MDFAEVLGKAWKIVWRHKILWVFGIFAGCARGGGGGGGGSGRISGSAPTGPNPFPQAEQFFNNFGDWVANHLWVIVLVVLAFLALFLLSLWLGTMGRIGLIRGAARADDGAEHLGFGDLWRESTPFFWRVLLLSVLVFLAFLLVILLIFVPAGILSVITLGLGLICLIPVICLFALASLAAGIVLEQVQLAIVLEDLGIREGVRRGWEVFKTNLGPVLLIWLILAVIGFVVGLVLAIPVLIAVIPVIIAYAANTSANPSYTPLLIAGLCVVAYLPFLIVLSGILNAYLESVWTLTYRRLTRPKEALESAPVPAPNA